MTDTLARQRMIIGTTAEWNANDLVLGAGEIALERMTTGDVRSRIGNGTLRFSQSPYLSAVAPFMNYRGNANPTLAPPSSANGDAYTAAPEGNLHAGWTGIAGQHAFAGDYMMLDVTGKWNLVPAAASGGAAAAAASASAAAASASAAAASAAAVTATLSAFSNASATLTNGVVATLPLTPTAVVAIGTASGTVFTLTKTGGFRIRMAGTWAVNGTGPRSFEIFRGITSLGVKTITPNASAATIHEFELLVGAVAGDTFHFDAHQASGGNLNLTGTTISITKVSDVPF